MQEQTISSALLEEKSKETGLVFSDLLGAAVLEETVRRIAASAQGEMFWLRNGTVLGNGGMERNFLCIWNMIMPYPKKRGIRRRMQSCS